jgi:hypothetical protein
MDAAKSRGKGTYEVFQSSMLRSVRDRHDVQHPLAGVPNPPDPRRGDPRP